MTPSGYAFASPAEAVGALAAMVGPVGTERAPLDRCAGRVLAEGISTDRASPACDVSAMDGFGVRIAEARLGVLPIAAEARMGQAPVVLPPGAAARVVTGAPLPVGAEAVVKREDVVEHADRIELIAGVADALKAGASIRRRGENAPGGTRIIDAGALVGAAQMAALASVGASAPLIYQRVRVGILVTGDELVPVGSAPTDWQLRDSNGPALECMFGALPFVEVHARRHAADNPDATVAAIAALASTVDVLFITGGVSMGDRDYVPGALGALGARVVFHKLPQRPGKPILAARLPDATPVLALPGNPVSVLVTARRIGMPVVRRRAGFGVPAEPPAGVTLAEHDGRHAELWWHRPVRLRAGGMASLVPNMGSGDVMATASSDGFVEIPPEGTGVGPWPFYPW